MRKQFNKLRNENVELQQKAALANVYSDELESLREKVRVNFNIIQLIKFSQKKVGSILLRLHNSSEFLCTLSKQYKKK